MKSDSDRYGEAPQFPIARSPQPDGELAIYDPRLNPYTPEDEIDLRDIWNTLVKYRWAILTFVGVVLATTLIATLLMRPVYKATTLIEVMPEPRGVVKFQSVDQTEYRSREYFQTQANILQSESVANAVISKLALDRNPEIGGLEQQRGFISGFRQLFSVFAKQQPAAAEQDAERIRRRAILARFSSRLSVSERRKSDLFEVSFESFDPVLSANAANAVVEEYKRLHEERRFDSTSGAKSFLEKELKRIQASLERSEKDLTEFARKFQVIDLEEKSNIMTTRLTDLNESLTRVQSERIAAQAIYNQVQKGNIEALPSILEEDLIKTLKNEYARLQGEYFKMSRIYKDAYPRLQQEKANLEQVKASLNEETAKLVASLSINYKKLSNEEQLLGEAVRDQKEALLNLQDRAIQYNILKREWETNKQLYSGLLERMKEVGVAAGMELNNISIIDRAVVPVGPYKPNLLSNVSRAGVFGLLGGLGLAFLLGYLDNTLRTPEELEKTLRLSSLGMVPKADIKAYPEAVSLDLLSHQERDSELSEAFRSIRTSLMFCSPDGVPKTLLVTSAIPSEGKSVNATNLAVVLAQNNAAVLLVDSDLRKPRVHRIFRKPLSPGLTECLIGKRHQTIHDTEIPNLSVMASGTLPPNPVELLSSSSMDSFLEIMGGMFDYVILDSAPVLGLADSIILSTKVQGTILTVNASATSKDAVRESVRRLRSVRAPLLGAILNMVDMNSSAYSYYCQYYYSYRNKNDIDLNKLEVAGSA